MRNPKIRYYLEAKSKDARLRNRHELIMAEINYGYRAFDKNGKRRNKPFRITLEATILPKNFGNDKSNFKFDADVFNRYSKTNATVKTKMNLLETAINKLTNNYLINAVIPKPEEFKNELKMELGQIAVNYEPEQTILDFVYGKIKSDEDDLEISQKKGIVEGTIKSYRTLSHHIENYQIATGDILTFLNFDKVKYWNFWRVIDLIYRGDIVVENPNQLIKQRKNKNGYASNTIQKHQKNLLRVLRLAKKDKVIVNLELDDDELTLLDAPSMKDYYVNESELQLVIDSNVVYDEKLQIAKDYVIISSLTGMRFESMRDTINTKIEYCNDDGYDFKYIHSIHNKTKTQVYVPLLQPVQIILEKNQGKFPKFPVNSVINEYIKDLFKVLEVNEEVVLTKVTYKSGTIVSREPKSNVISTHDFKHSFYSNLFVRKMKASVIDSITHPDKAPTNPMALIYNRADMLDKAKMFVDEINKIESKIYKF